MSMYWRIFNFLVRRVVAVGFIVVGLAVGLMSLPALLPGGTVNIDGSPTSDIALRLVSVFLPLVVGALGVALYRAVPFDPSTNLSG